MDDRTFDETSAREWIETIEALPSSPRDHDIYPRLNAWIRNAQPATVLERANERYARDSRRFIQGSAYALPFEDETFDAAFSVAVWHLLGDLQAAARELGRILRAGSSFLIITANPAGYSLWSERYAETRVDGRRLEGRARNSDGSFSLDVLYLHTLEELTGSLESAGLKTRSTETFRTVKNQDCFVAIEGDKMARRPVAADQR